MGNTTLGQYYILVGGGARRAVGHTSRNGGLAHRRLPDYRGRIVGRSSLLVMGHRAVSIFVCGQLWYGMAMGGRD